MIRFLETIFFRGRVLVLAAIAVATVILGFEATKIHLDPGFYKGLPTNHEYIKTFDDYKDRLFGSNRVIVVLENTKGDIWNTEFLKTLNGITQDSSRASTAKPAMRRPRSAWRAASSRQIQSAGKRA